MIKKFLRIDFILVSIILIRLLMLILLVSSNKVLNTDASTIATMGLEILKNGARPFYIYWQVYNGAAALRAYFLSAIFYLYEITPNAVRFVCLFFDFLIILLLYSFVNRWFNRNTARLTVLLYIFTPALFFHTISGLSGYQETIIFNILMVGLFYKIIYSQRKELLSWFLLGIISGFAYYVFELSIILIFTMLLWLFIFDKLFFIRKSFGLFLIGFLLGNFPAIYFNFTRDFVNWKYMWSTKFDIIPAFFPGLKWLRIFYPIIVPVFLIKKFGLRVFAGIFEVQDEGKTIFWGEYRSLYTDYIQLLIFVFIILVNILYYKSDLYLYLKNFFSKNSSSISSFKICFVISYIILLGIATIYNPQGYRFFYPALPFWCILAALVIMNFWRKGQKFFPIFLPLFIVIDVTIKWWLAINTPQTCGNFSIDFFKERLAILYNEKCGVISEVIDFLKKEGINFVIAPYHATPITFYSKGEIVGSIFGYSNFINRRDNPFNYKFDRFAILVYKDTIFDKIAIDFLSQNEIKPLTKTFDSLILYYPVDKKYLYNTITGFLPE